MQVCENFPQTLLHEYVVLVESDSIDIMPLAHHGGPKSFRVQGVIWWLHDIHELCELTGEVFLDDGFVRVPESDEERLPHSEHLVL